VPAVKWRVNILEQCRHGKGVKVACFWH